MGGDGCAHQGHDGPAQREFAHAEKTLRAADQLPVALAPRGGFAVRLTPGR